MSSNSSSEHRGLGRGQPMSVENAATPPNVGKRGQSSSERAYYKRRRFESRAIQQRQPGCDRGGRPGGSIGPRRKEPAGWQQRRGCKCPLHYGGHCRDYIVNPKDVPRRRRKVRPHVPVKYLRCNRCNTIGHLGRDCYMSRYDAQRVRKRVEHSHDGLFKITACRRIIKKENAATQSSDEERLVIDETQPENEDEDADIGSPPAVEIAAGEELDDDFEIRSEAEMSENDLEIYFSSTDEEEERAQAAMQPQLRQPRTQPQYIVIPQVRMPSPEIMMLQMKQGEESLRRALLERADQKRRQDAVIRVENADTRKKQLVVEARANNERIMRNIDADNQPSTSGYRVTRSQAQQEVKKTQPRFGIAQIKNMLERIESEQPVVVCEVLSDADRSSRKKH